MIRRSPGSPGPSFPRDPRRERPIRPRTPTWVLLSYGILEITRRGKQAVTSNHSPTAPTAVRGEGQTSLERAAAFAQHAPGRRGGTSGDPRSRSRQPLHAGAGPRARRSADDDLSLRPEPGIPACVGRRRHPERDSRSGTRRRHLGGAAAKAPLRRPSGVRSITPACRRTWGTEDHVEGARLARRRARRFWPKADSTRRPLSCASRRCSPS